MQSPGCATMAAAISVWQPSASIVTRPPFQVEQPDQHRQGDDLARLVIDGSERQAVGRDPSADQVQGSLTGAAVVGAAQGMAHGAMVRRSSN
jgi:hypothetical protein